MPYNFDLSERLRIAVHINPEIWDIIQQIGTRWSEGTRLVMGAMVVKSIAMETAVEEIKPELNRIGKDLFNNGVKAMRYEDDTWYCGTPYPHHLVPFNPVNASFNYLSEEERERLIARLVHYHTGDPARSKRSIGSLLIWLSDNIASKEISASLSQIGHQIIETDEGK